MFGDVLTLLEEGNLSRAAERRNITQPAFSRRIRAFEDWVGMPLLDRAPNRVGLHPTLDANADEIRATIRRIEELRARLRSAGAGTARLVVVTQHALAARITPDALGAIHRVEPTMTMRLRTMNREDCVSFFVRGDADLLMIYEARGFPPLPFDDSISRRVWMPDTLIPVCGGAMRHSLASDQKPKGRFAIIRYPEDSHFGQLVSRSGNETAMMAAGGHVVVETAFSVAALELALAGIGVAWIPHSMCIRKLASGELVNLGAHFGLIPLDVSLFHAKKNRQAQQIVAQL
ncbi:LysR family transcriptional regulator [Roseibaca sp. Y0-43]|uniref:LysR family transcriptional regulator n=1 Tax=Roseibaca sp. Y0-43 TaxID=2816854 RepID=UPI001D0C3FD4|nr:LysR substrate-binding domain-containing protein [Roseibaca sp. Y0-43]MCC1481277.1 LysR family transcriptional regulator [Roseibaca sp. Y0-43]